MSDPRRPIKAWQVMGENFELETKYKVVDYLGAGAYGMVCAVQDSEDNGIIAIKKCKKIFQSRTLAKRTLREMRLLRQFNHENIVKLRSILLPSDLRFYSDLYLTFEIMDTDLAQIIRSPQPLKEQHTQYFVYQLLRALEYLHSKNIVHRDIKPRNILVNADCTLKVADFGLARLYNSDGPESVVAITDYVTTRWYRAPEVIVGWSRYGSAIDMWAVGCIIAELISRTPLFPGENTMKQLGLIIRIMGAPNENFIMHSQKALFRQYMLTLMHKRAAQMSLLLPTASPDALDLIRRLLDYDPARRPGASLCLAHRFISGMSLSLSPPVCSPMHIAKEEFDFEERKPCIDDLRSEINFEIAYYNQDAVQVQVLSPGLSILIPKPYTSTSTTTTTTAMGNSSGSGSGEGMDDIDGSGVEVGVSGDVRDEGGEGEGDGGVGSAGNYSYVSPTPLTTTLPTIIPNSQPTTLPSVTQPTHTSHYTVQEEEDEEEGSVQGTSSDGGMGMVVCGGGGSAIGSSSGSGSGSGSDDEVEIKVEEVLEDTLPIAPTHAVYPTAHATTHATTHATAYPTTASAAIRSVCPTSQVDRKRPPTPLVQRLDSSDRDNSTSSNTGAANTYTNSDTRPRTTTYPTTAHYFDPKSTTTHTTNITQPTYTERATHTTYAIPTTTSPHFSDSSSATNTNTGSNNSAELSASVVQGMGMHLLSNHSNSNSDSKSNSGSGDSCEYKDERMDYSTSINTSTNNTATNATTHRAGVSGMKASSITGPHKSEPNFVYNTYDTYDPERVNSASKGSTVKNSGVYAQDLRDVPSTGISGSGKVDTQYMPLPSTNTSGVSTSIRTHTHTSPPVNTTHPARPVTTTANTTTTYPTPQQQQRQLKERQRDGDAALVSSYFTCFCEHEEERVERQEMELEVQEQSREKERRRVVKERESRGIGSSGIGSGSGGDYKHRYRATSLQEESKQADTDTHPDLEAAAHTQVHTLLHNPARTPGQTELAKREYLNQQSRMEEGNFSHSAHMPHQYRPIGSGNGGTRDKSVNGGRDRSDSGGSGGRRKAWDSCIVM